MKLFIYIVALLITGFSYSQTLRNFEVDAPSTISDCTHYSPVKTRAREISAKTDVGVLIKNILEATTHFCQEYQSCNLLPYTTEEPVVVSCICSIRYSPKHPEYPEDFTGVNPYGSRRWISDGVNMDISFAEEEAREDCTHKFNSHFNEENPEEHWRTKIHYCGVKYRYECADGSTAMRIHFYN